MSQENVDLVRRLYELQAARDPKLLELFDPHVVWINFASAVETKPYVGHEGIVEWASSFMADIRDFHFEAWEVIDASGDKVVGVCRVRGTGARSGVPIDREDSCLFLLLNGKIVRGQGFETRAQALEAAGLSE